MTTDTAGGSGERYRAPGALRLVQDFLNRPDGSAGPLEGRQPRPLGEWLAARGLIDPRTELSAAEVARAWELRDALRSLLFANSGAALDPGATETLNRIGRAAPLRAAFAPDGTAGLEPAAAGIDAAIGRLLTIVVGAIADGTWNRLKLCRADACRWAFYDASKNRSRAWCSMAVCGNRNKVREYQRRQRAASEAWRGARGE